ncbi:unnamed protein product [Clonostachys rosea f. rosea IK726]|uniref:Uncharacterized protein n=1 Tax=Clonostachys rosea f. rosea IK726 TaxID=1349383 RepID=A0ACA9TJA9_BIOOC|nr:unnamed protein product [Clonostachys rosea f. rosea IK726]
MTKGFTVPMLCINTVPYLELKFCPVSWRKMFTPIVIRVRFRLASEKKPSLGDPFLIFWLRAVRISLNSTSISSEEYRPSLSKVRDLKASSERSRLLHIPPESTIRRLPGTKE